MALHKYNYRDMKTQVDKTCYCPQVQVHSKQVSRVASTALYSKSIYSTRVHQMSCIYSVKQTQERLQYLRYKSLGTNKEVTYASRSRFRRTVHTGSRFGPRVRRLIVSNKRGKSTVHSWTRVPSNPSLCIPQWSVSRTSKWNRDYSKLYNNFHYLHDAVDGRLINGDIFTTQ